MSGSANLQSLLPPGLLPPPLPVSGRHGEGLDEGCCRLWLQVVSVVRHQGVLSAVPEAGQKSVTYDRVTNSNTVSDAVLAHLSARSAAWADSSEGRSGVKTWRGRKERR